MARHGDPTSHRGDSGFPTVPKEHHAADAFRGLALTRDNRVFFSLMQTRTGRRSLKEHQGELQIMCNELQMIRISQGAEVGPLEEVRLCFFGLLFTRGLGLMKQRNSAML